MHIKHIIIAKCIIIRSINYMKGSFPYGYNESYFLLKTGFIADSNLIISFEHIIKYESNRESKCQLYN